MDGFGLEWINLVTVPSLSIGITYSCILKNYAFTRNALCLCEILIWVIWVNARNGTQHKVLRLYGDICWHLICRPCLNNWYFTREDKRKKWILIMLIKFDLFRHPQLNFMLAYFMSSVHNIWRLIWRRKKSRADK